MLILNTVTFLFDMLKSPKSPHTYICTYAWENARTRIWFCFRWPRISAKHQPTSVHPHGRTSVSATQSATHAACVYQSHVLIAWQPVAIITFCVQAKQTDLPSF